MLCPFTMRFCRIYLNWACLCNFLTYNWVLIITSEFQIIGWSWLYKTDISYVLFPITYKLLYQAECYHYLFDAAIKLHQLGLDWSTPSHGPIRNVNGVWGCSGNFSRALKTGPLSLDYTIEPSQVSLGCSLFPRRNIRIDNLSILLSCVTLISLWGWGLFFLLISCCLLCSTVCFLTLKGQQLLFHLLLTFFSCMPMITWEGT